MDIFVAGGSGVLGRSLLPLLTRKHRVVAMVRGDKKGRVVEGLGAQAFHGDLFDADSIAEGAKGCDALVRIATHIPAKSILKPRMLATNDRIRTEGTRALIAAAHKVGASQILNESIVWVAQPSDGSPFDETSPGSRLPFARSTLEGESMALEAASDGMVSTVLRLGWFYSPDAFHTRDMARSLKKRKMPMVGKKPGIKSLIHIADAASAIATAIETPRTGLFHVTDDEPVPMYDFMAYFADLLDSAAPGRIPAWLARLFIGKMGVDFVTSSMETNNRSFRESFGWTPNHPTYREGLVQVIETWKREGFLQD